MLILSSTVRSLKAVLGGAVSTNQLPVLVHAENIRADTPDQVGFECQITNTNSTTAVFVSTAPSAGVTKVIRSISIQNADTAAATITVTYDDNTTGYVIFKATLAVGDQAYYEDSAGWQVLTSAGALK